MIEDLFVGRVGGRVKRTAMGEIASAYLSSYGDLIGELAESIKRDAAAFAPASLKIVIAAASIGDTRSIPARIPSTARFVRVMIRSSCGHSPFSLAPGDDPAGA